MSLRLERTLGHLPADWHTLPIRELRRTGRRTATRRRTLDTSVALRAIAIVLVVGTHAGLFNISGGAHLLLGVAGFNLGRFHLTSAERRERVRRLSASVARIAVPSVAWIALALVLTDDYRLTNVFLLNTALGPHVWPDKHFWFVEALLYILVALAVAMTIPYVDRVERRFPFGLPLTLAMLALVARYDLVVVDLDAPLPTPIRAFWLFALGWAAAKAVTIRHRLSITILVVATVPGFFDNFRREAVVIVGFGLLVWVPRVWSTEPSNRLAGLLAGSSLYIYLTHWQVYPHLTDESPALALVASLAVGVLYSVVAAHAMAKLRFRRRAPGPAPLLARQRARSVRPASTASAPDRSGRGM
jgi:hypothetical protein